MSKEIVAQKSCIEKFLRIVHPTNGRICLVIINRDTGEVNERYTTPSRIPKFISFLRYCNANGCDIYFTPSELKPQSRKRTKSDFLDSQQIVFLEFDSPNQFNTLINNRVIPYPSAVVGSSEGRNHVYWKLVDPIPKGKQEELMANLARSIGADRAATDVSRVLRLPTFCNKKPERRNYQSQLVYPNRPDDPKIQTTFEELISICENYEETDIPSQHAAACAAVLIKRSSTLDRSAQDWALVNQKLFEERMNPEDVQIWLMDRRGDKPNPHYYSTRTIKKALISKGDLRHKDWGEARR
jgi:hypothetical protein